MEKAIVTDPALLKQKCTRVPLGDHPHQLKLEYVEIINDLQQTAKKFSRVCAGLAANQIGYNCRIIVIKDASGEFIPFVNPEIIQRLGGIKSEKEGCLSRAEYDEKGNLTLLHAAVKTRRYKQIRVNYFCPIQRRILTIDLKGFDARVMQHEIDHLNGKII